jgi:thioesterase domain-containing protein
LEDRGCQIANFVAIDTRPPVAKNGELINTRTQKEAVTLKDRLALAHMSMALTRRALRGLTMLYSRLQGRADLALEVKSELVERACYVADNAYRAERYPDRVLVIHSKAGPPRSYDWDHVSREVEHVNLPIDHFDMFFQPDVSILSAELRHRFAMQDQENVVNS